jgi:hypothetical protein
MVQTSDGKHTGKEDPEADRPRRLIVLLIAVATAWLTAAFLSTGVDGEWAFDLFGTVVFAEGQRGLPTLVVAILASGGSAFWNHVIDYTKAVKEIRRQIRDGRTSQPGG